ncbi:hypothetical protein KCU95_g12843, partial [Aureobasidium melanogenum]
MATSPHNFQTQVRDHPRFWVVTPNYDNFSAITCAPIVFDPAVTMHIGDTGTGKSATIACLQGNVALEGQAICRPHHGGDAADDQLRLYRTLLGWSLDT